MFKAMAMQRLNVSIPEDVRDVLRRLADAGGLKEAELARELLVGAIEQASRAAFHRRMASAHSPELRERLREISEALENLDAAR